MRPEQRVDSEERDASGARGVGPVDGDRRAPRRRIRVRPVAGREEVGRRQAPVHGHVVRDLGEPHRVLDERRVALGIGAADRAGLAALVVPQDDAADVLLERGRDAPEGLEHRLDVLRRLAGFCALALPSGLEAGELRAARLGRHEAGAVDARSDVAATAREEGGVAGTNGRVRRRVLPDSSGSCCRSRRSSPADRPAPC